MDRPPARHLRRAHPLDRIYQEVEATGGDIRALCDLFGMSIANAARWATTVGPDLRHKNS